MATERFNISDQNNTEETFDTTGLLLAYLANWKWFAISVIVCLFGAVLFAVTRIPTYQVDAAIYLSDENTNGQNAFNMKNLENPMVAFKNQLDETQVEILKSRNHLTKVVDSLGLMYTYYSEGTFRKKALYLDNAFIAEMNNADIRALQSTIEIEVSPNGNGKYDIVEKSVVTDQKEGEKIKEKNVLEDVTLPQTISTVQGDVVVKLSPIVSDFKDTQIVYIDNPRTIADQISKSLSIEFAKNSEKIMRLSLNTEVTAMGIDIVEAMLDFYNSDIIEDKNRSANQTEAFILDRLQMINNELSDVENRLKEYRQTHNVTDIQAQATLNLTLQSDYEKDLAKLEAELAIYEDIDRIISIADTYELLPSAVSDPNIPKIIDNYNRKVSQLTRTLEGSTPDNPLVLSVQQDLNREKATILKNITTARRTLESQISSLRRLEVRSTGELASQPTVDKGFQEIFREQKVKENIYTFLLERREEIALQKTLATNTARLIDDPLDNVPPVTPKKMIILAFAFLLGIAIPAAIIFIRRMVFPVFADKEELQRLTSIPVLGEICSAESNVSGKKAKKMTSAKDSNIVVGRGLTTPASELFRLLRNNIAFTRNGVDSKVILLTSTISGEGKTFVAANLALTYALLGKKVLVIGMDLRRPMLAHQFGFNNRLGATSFLAGQETDLSKLILPSKENEKLFILPAGPVPPNPNELLMSENMNRLMEYARSEFDYVIIDSAPIGLVSDTLTILRHTDLQIYVTRANFTSKGSLKVLEDAVNTGKFSAVYIVVNGVNMTTGSYVYRNYGSYNGKSRVYGYGYGYNHHKKEEPID